jgi:hypothetical protein
MLESETVTIVKVLQMVTGVLKLTTVCYHSRSSGKNYITSGKDESSPVRLTPTPARMKDYKEICEPPVKTI